MFQSFEFSNLQGNTNGSILNWSIYIKQFGQYLKLERSLSQNSIDAYLRDVEKLQQYLELSGSKSTPLKITTKELQKFIHYINELGMSAYSQARILSGVKAFFKYLEFEELIDSNPASLLEGPKIGRKLPDTLEYHDIIRLFDAIDLSSSEGARNRAMLE